jgi:two-component system sensor histidine kinase UhpB
MRVERALQSSHDEIQGLSGRLIEAQDAQERAATLTQSVRNLSHDLHPQVLRRAGLVDALRAHCAEIERRHTLALNVEVQGDRRSLPSAVTLCLYRVAQETLRNVVRHSGARHADIRLVCDDTHVELTISDDGEGFDIGETRRRGTGLGLVSVNERVRLAGGTVDFSSAARRGTQVQVCIPLVAPASDGEEPSSGHCARIA